MVLVQEGYQDKPNTLGRGALVVKPWRQHFILGKRASALTLPHARRKSSKQDRRAEHDHDMAEESIAFGDPGGTLTMSSVRLPRIIGFVG